MTAIEEGKYTLYAENEMVIDKGKYIVIWEQVEGKWLLDRDIWNTSNPVPTPDPDPEPLARQSRHSILRLAPQQAKNIIDCSPSQRVEKSRYICCLKSWL